ncbi:MAG: phosphodiester glycosidase family protein [Acidobacteriota bacterium]
MFFRRALCAVAFLIVAHAETVVEKPFAGITHIHHTESAPRNVSIHVVLVDLAQPGLRFHLTSPGGSRETVRQTTLEFLREQHAQVAVNAHFFLPYPSQDSDAFVVGLAASDGKVYSDFETPEQAYALLANAPALNIDAENHARIVRPATRGELRTAVAGSAQIVTEGVRTIPVYKPGELTPGGPNNYSNIDSWYERVNARTMIGLSQDARQLVLFVVDRMTVGEAADFLIANYGVWNALNLDGGGSTTLAMEDPSTHEAILVNAPSEGSTGRAVGSNLAVFAPVN